MNRAKTEDVECEVSRTTHWQAFKACLAALDKQMVHPVVLRDEPNEHLQWRELDLLIDPLKVEKATEVLTSMGWELIDTGRFIPLKRAMVLLNESELLKLDIHLEPVDGPYVYMGGDWIHKTATRHHLGFNIPSNEAWLMHVLLHTVLGKKVLDKKYHERILLLLAHGVDKDVIIEQASRYNLSHIVERLLRNPVELLSDAQKVFLLKRETKKKLRWLGNGNFHRLISFQLAWKFGQALGQRKGVLIAVIGPDGAGKTTFLGALSSTLTTLQIPSRTRYMGPWEYPVLPSSRFLRYMGATPLDLIANTDTSNKRATRYSKLLKGQLKRYAYYANVLPEMWSRYFIWVFPHLRLRRVVIADRYVYDLEVGYHNTPVDNSPWLRKLIIKLVPTPDFVIILDNDAETIYQRKKEYSLDVIREALERYRKVANARGFVVIRTNQPADELARRFIEQNWREITRLRRDG